MDVNEKLLELRDLETSFYLDIGEVKAVRSVSFTLKKGESLGIVGESGSGKSITAKSILRLIKSPGRVKNGQILFKGKNLIHASKSEMKRIRGNEIAMIFQDPMTSLNPVYTIGNQIASVIKLHQGLNKGQAQEKAVEMLKLVGIPEAEKRMGAYPHECSGGMKQRVMIAMALSCEPDVLIADEPTTALDVTIQAQILELIQDIRKKLGTAVIFISHDLGVVSQVCDTIAVMYGGQIMEMNTAEELFTNPRHAYTRGLLGAIPIMDADDSSKRLMPIEGSPPDLLNPPLGCPFAPRCKTSMNICQVDNPELYQVDGQGQVSCWRYYDNGGKNIEGQ
jgi:oligopeptide transport system ATP-binding protein